MTIQALYDRFRVAELAADRPALERLLADDFQSIGEQGYVLGKARWIARFDDFRYVTLTATELDVRTYTGAGVVRYAQHSESIWQGNPMSLHTRASQLWVRNPDAWQLAGIQFSSLPG